MHFEYINIDSIIKNNLTISNLFMKFVLPSQQNMSFYFYSMQNISYVYVYNCYVLTFSFTNW